VHDTLTCAARLLAASRLVVRNFKLSLSTRFVGRVCLHRQPAGMLFAQYFYKVLDLDPPEYTHMMSDVHNVTIETTYYMYHT
jgi:hypothetical protein